jgi:Cytochrome C oxidase, cbb3-type, subunit III
MAESNQQTHHLTLRAPSAALLQAALTGILFSAACGDEEKPDQGVQEASDAGIGSAECMCPEVTNTCTEKDAAAESKEDAGEPVVSDASADAAVDASTGAPIDESKEIPGTQKEAEFHFADLKKKCDDLGGYIQVHAICGGTNSCAGFSYYDGMGPHTYFEHTCSAANWCKGYSCVVLPEDGRRTGDDIYNDKCVGCHSNGDDPPTKFLVYVEAGSPRIGKEWPDLPAEQHEKITAFGKMSLGSDGSYYANMPSYHASFSRAEIQRVVAYLRALEGEYVPWYTPTP